LLSRARHKFVVDVATSWDEKLRDLTLLTEEGFRFQLTDMGLSSDEVDYQLERTRPALVRQMIIGAASGASRYSRLNPGGDATT
jgi:hypothetical protein